MGRLPSNGAPTFRFSSTEVAQMEAILQKYEVQLPPRELLVALAQRFSNSPDRAGKIEVQMKQVWNWFQNRRYQLRAKLVKSPGTSSTSSVSPDEVTTMRDVPPAPKQMAVSSGSHVVRNTSESSQMEFEAKSARDGAWYDVQQFISHRYLETSNPEVLVRFAGFGPEEDEWVNVLKHVRHRSLPCEASECIVVTAGDLILCFQEGKEQALYFDAHVLDAQRRRHDVRGCRCRFLVRYDHDQSEEIVPLRKICRRPETDYRLQLLHAADEQTSTSVSVNPPKPNAPAADADAIPPPPGFSARPATAQAPSQTAPALVQAPTPSPSSIEPLGPLSSLVVTPTPAPSSVLVAPVPCLPAPSIVSGQTSASVTIEVTETPESKMAQCPEPEKLETDNQVLEPISEPMEIETHNPASIPVIVSEQAEVKPNNPCIAPLPASEPTTVKTEPVEKFESDNQVLEPVSEPMEIETHNPSSIPVIVSEQTEVKPNNPSIAPLPAPEPTTVMTDCPPPVPELITNPDIENDNPAAVPIPIAELNKVIDVNPGTPFGEAGAHANDSIPATDNSDPQDAELTAITVAGQENKEITTPGGETVLEGTSGAETVLATTEDTNSTMPTEDMENMRLV